MDQRTRTRSVTAGAGARAPAAAGGARRGPDAGGDPASVRRLLDHGGTAGPDAHRSAVPAISDTPQDAAGDASAESAATQSTNERAAAPDQSARAGEGRRGRVEGAPQHAAGARLAQRCRVAKGLYRARRSARHPTAGALPRFRGADRAAQARAALARTAEPGPPKAQSAIAALRPPARRCLA